MSLLKLIDFVCDHSCLYLQDCMKIGITFIYHILYYQRVNILVNKNTCFLFQVRRVIKQKWYRFKIQHVPRSSRRRRSSRTSSFFLSPNTEVHPLRALKNKMCPALTGHVVNKDPEQGFQVHSHHTCDVQDKHGCPCTCSWGNDTCECCCCTDIEDDE